MTGTRLVFYFSLLLVNVCLASAQSSFFEISSPWVWVCEGGKCLRKLGSETANGKSMAVCKLTCYESSVFWPKPTGKSTFSKDTSAFIANNVKVTKTASSDSKTKDLLLEGAAIFTGYMQRMESNGLDGSARECSVAANTCATSFATADHLLNIEISVTGNAVQLAIDTDESYTLDVTTVDSVTTAYIVAGSYFGARHAMETLSQLVVWDEMSNSLVVVRNAHVEDSPVFPHRGFAIDTARNFMEVSLLKRIIDGLSYNKLNVLHWHLTDSNSFPFVSSREPLMAIYGAHTARQVYRPADIQELVHYAQVRGVKILPEIDAPSHVGGGWQWGEKYGLGDLVLCVDKQPWDEYCAQPPCGILNPVNDNVYKVLGNIYRDIADLFQSDMFHMGGDEVNMRCWNETDEITNWMEANGLEERNDESFLKLWSRFQNISLAKLDEAYGRTQPVILWNSDLTAKGHAQLYLDRDRYILQFWDGLKDTSNKLLYEAGYKLIMSNVDALYLDCGFSGWVGEALNNWCSPYISWKTIYANSPRAMTDYFNLTYNKEQFLGGEAALWAEQAKGLAIEGKIWPRLSALAERFWTDPTTGWRPAETRLHIQRERMVDRGITADPLQPEWCMQNDDSCFL